MQPVKEEPPRNEPTVEQNTILVAAVAFCVVLVLLALIGPYLPGVPKGP